MNVTLRAVRGGDLDAFFEHQRDEARRPRFAATSPDNAASQRVLEKCGFVRRGTRDGRILLELAERDR